MKYELRAAALAIAVASAPAAFGQELGDRPARISLPGMTFTRSLNGAAENASVAAGKLSLRSEAKRDNFRDPDGKLSNNTAPVLLGQVDNAKPWTLTARLTPTFAQTYDAGALYIWVRDDLWLKMAMERDERGKVRVVTVRTNGTSDDNNHDVVAAPSAHFKISSDTKTVGFYYSLDGETWQLVRLFKNDYPARIWAGVSAQSPMGDGATTTFEAVSHTTTSISDFRLGK